MLEAHFEESEDLSDSAKESKDLSDSASTNEYAAVGPKSAGQEGTGRQHLLRRDSLSGRGLTAMAACQLCRKNVLPSLLKMFASSPTAPLCRCHQGRYHQHRLDRNLDSSRDLWVSRGLISSRAKAQGTQKEAFSVSLTQMALGVKQAPMHVKGNAGYGSAELTARQWQAYKAQHCDNGMHGAC